MGTHPYNVILYNFTWHIGAGFYIGGGVGRIVNNSILESSSDGRIPQLLCLSGSSGSAVGQWIGPDGTILTTIQSDPFDVIFGDNNNPGQMIVETPITNPSIMATHEGVYTCMIPNESDDIEYLRIGIYLSGSSGECISNVFYGSATT